MSFYENSRARVNVVSENSTSVSGGAMQKQFEKRTRSLLPEFIVCWVFLPNTVKYRV